MRYIRFYNFVRAVFYPTLSLYLHWSEESYNRGKCIWKSTKYPLIDKEK